MPKRVGSSNQGGRFRPLTKREIEEAQRNTKSNAAAARWLGCSFKRYERYAKIYNLYDSHSNRRGVGTNKGFASRPSSIPLKDIFDNKHKDYNMVRLKNRMIARGLIREECAICGFHEKRITDSKTPLLLTFKKDQKNFSQDNLQLLCYNCCFLTTGAPTVANRGYIEKSFKDPEAIPKRWQVDPRPADVIDVGETDSDKKPGDFSDIKDQILRQLGRK